MTRFAKHLVLLLLILVVINAAPQRRQTNPGSLDQRSGDLLMDTRAPQRRPANPTSLPETRWLRECRWEGGQFRCV